MFWVCFVHTAVTGMQSWLAEKQDYIQNRKIYSYSTFLYHLWTSTHIPFLHVMSDSFPFLQTMKIPQTHLLQISASPGISCTALIIKGQLFHLKLYLWFFLICVMDSAPCGLSFSHNTVGKALATAVTQAIPGLYCSFGESQSFLVSGGPILSVHLVLKKLVWEGGWHNCTTCLSGGWKTTSQSSPTAPCEGTTLISREMHWAMCLATAQLTRDISQCHISYQRVTCMKHFKNNRTSFRLINRSHCANTVSFCPLYF